MRTRTSPRNQERLWKQLGQEGKQEMAQREPCSRCGVRVHERLDGQCRLADIARHIARTRTSQPEVAQAVQSDQNWKRCPHCGSTDTRYYDGALGYEAVRCMECRKETDLNNPDSWCQWDETWRTSTGGTAQ